MKAQARKLKTRPLNSRQLITKKVTDRKNQEPAIRKELNYTPRARQFARQNQGIIRTFLQARQELKHQQEGEITLGRAKINKLKRKGVVHAGIYKVKIDGQVFFVKETDRLLARDFLEERDHANFQIKALQKARHALSKIKGAEAAQYHLAWTCGKSSFLVTKYYQGIEMSSATLKHAGLIKRMSQISNLLLAAGLIDVSASNMIYLPKEDKIIVFDMGIRE